MTHTPEQSAALATALLTELAAPSLTIGELKRMLGPMRDDLRIAFEADGEEFTRLVPRYNTKTDVVTFVVR